MQHDGPPYKLTVLALQQFQYYKPIITSNKTPVVVMPSIAVDGMYISGGGRIELRSIMYCNSIL
jgi:hypothetical protein